MQVPSFLKKEVQLDLGTWSDYYSKSMHTCFCHFWLKKHVKIQVVNGE